LRKPLGRRLRRDDAVKARSTVIITKVSVFESTAPSCGGPSPRTYAWRQSPARKEFSRIDSHSLMTRFIANAAGQKQYKGASIFAALSFAPSGLEFVLIR